MGVLGRFNLAREGSSILGSCSLTLPDGEIMTGIADGKWIV